MMSTLLVASWKTLPFPSTYLPLGVGEDGVDDLACGAALERDAELLRRGLAQQHAGQRGGGQEEAHASSFG